MEKINLDKTFWDTMWKNNMTGWDLKAVSPPLKSYFDSIEQKDISILIPGCGNAYEAKYLLKNGFKNITIIDISPTLVSSLLVEFNDYIGKTLSIVCGDFFKHSGQYDLIVEQTFFCTLYPEDRPLYTQHLKTLLKPNGKLVGLLFDIDFGKPHPPFGGCKDEYLNLFQQDFEVITMSTSDKSVKPRLGTELWTEMKLKIK